VPRRALKPRTRLSSEIAGVPNLTRSAKTQLAARRPTDLRRFSYAGKSDACASLEPGYMIVQFKQEVVPMKTLARALHRSARLERSILGASM
jgi:hypothetical protein